MHGIKQGNEKSGSFQCVKGLHVACRNSALTSDLMNSFRRYQLNERWQTGLFFIAVEYCNFQTHSYIEK